MSSKTDGICAMPHQAPWMVKGLDEARKSLGITELQARTWCTSTLVRACVAEAKHEAHAGTAVHSAQQLAMKLSTLATLALLKF